LTFVPICAILRVSYIDNEIVLAGSVVRPWMRYLNLG
jgi:hypothetical protein